MHGFACAPEPEIVLAIAVDPSSWPCPLTDPPIPYSTGTNEHLRVTTQLANLLAKFGAPNSHSAAEPVGTMPTDLAIQCVLCSLRGDVKAAISILRLECIESSDALAFFSNNGSLHTTYDMSLFCNPAAWWVKENARRMVSSREMTRTWRAKQENIIRPDG
jgi:hypothetical protein